MYSNGIDNLKKYPWVKILKKTNLTFVPREPPTVCLPTTEIKRNWKDSNEITFETIRDN